MAVASQLVCPTALLKAVNTEMTNYLINIKRVDIKMV